LTRSGRTGFRPPDRLLLSAFASGADLPPGGTAMKKGLAFAVGAASVAVLARWLAPIADLRGAVVLVTGGSRGLGLVLCRELARRGARLAICARDEEELERARKDLEARGAEVLTVACDVRIPAGAERLVTDTLQRFGGLDVVINNAGIIQVGPYQSMSLNDFQKAMAVNFWGAVHVTLAALPHLRQSSVRRIVDACERGEAFVTVGFQAKVLRIAHSLAPGLTTRVLGLVNSLLPEPGGAGPEDAAEPGYMHRSAVNEPSIREAGDRAARDNNEVGYSPA